MKRKCKGGADGKTWRRLKKMAIVVFENLSAQQFFKVPFLFLIVFGRDICLTFDEALILSFTSNFSSFIAKKDA